MSRHRTWRHWVYVESQHNESEPVEWSDIVIHSENVNVD